MGDITVRVNGTPHSPTVMEEEGSFLHHDLASITSPPARMRRTWARTGEEPGRCARAGQGSCCRFPAVIRAVPLADRWEIR